MVMKKGDFTKGVGFVIFLTMALFLFMPVGEAGADMLSYAAKFVCGSKSTDTGAVKGLYATGVNIHNPQLKEVQFMKKAVVAFAERNTTRGPISGIHPEVLDSDQAMEVDCKDIRDGLFTGVALPAHIEGFVVIMVPVDPTGGIVPELDVVTKVTARHRGSATDFTSDVESIDIETVNPKRILTGN